MYTDKNLPIIVPSGAPVFSQRFGKGIVKSATREYIEVRFYEDEEKQTKIFFYPAVLLFGGLEIDMAYLKSHHVIICDDSEIDEMEAYYKEYGPIKRGGDKVKYISMNEWLTKDRIDELLTEEQIEYITQEYGEIFNDEHNLSTKGEEVELMTGLPFVQKYFDYLMGFVTDDIDTLDEFIMEHAKIKLKAQILDASQTLFEIPLWKEEGGLGALVNAINDLKEYYDDETIQDWGYVTFYPFVAKEICIVDKYQIKWAINVLEDFRDFADDKSLYLSEKEKADKDRKRKEELAKLEDILWGKKKKD